MNKIKAFLEDGTDKTVKLYFLERHKHWKTKKINYDVYKTKIKSEISNDLLNNAKKIIKTYSTQDTIEYGNLAGSDQNYVETIGKDEVPFLSKVLNQLSGVLTDFEYDKTGDVSYIVKIENSKKILYLFRKYNPKMLVKKGLLSLVLHEGRYQKFDKNLLFLDNDFDAALLLKLDDGTESKEKTSESEKGYDEVFIFTRRNFEFMFSFTDYYENEVVTKEKEIEDKNMLGNTSFLVDLCKKNSTMARKLVKILKSDFYDKMSLDGIKKVVKDYGVDDVKFDSDGKVVVTDKNVWHVLRILDDDYLESKITSNKYEAHSKVQKK
ncbi:MAG: DUF4868 domain-containing protein [Methanobacteriaceae archaeon]|nr:DUF4868 domain-containing protein [Methanobacteriaceae archaeon]MDP3484385.1 DUF4868 domain-containing protein [Methanobacteriaceae archaeon]MDP3624844.1 DUF4868 domain-containing protein [Methanobacteriaceae archaeon]